MPLKVGELFATLKLDRSEFDSGLRGAEKDSTNSMSRIGGSAVKTGSVLTGALTVPLTAIGIGSLKAAITFESAFAGVRKTVDGTEADFRQLEAGIRDMAKQLPASAVEISNVAAAAGQLGIKKENILEFSRVMIDLGESTNLSAEMAATQLARLANITQMPQTEFERLGSVVVALGNNLATTEAEIVEMGLRLAGAGNIVGLTEDQILSMAGALSSVGIDAQAGGTAFSKVMIEMASAVNTPLDAIKNITDELGITEGQLWATMAKGGDALKELAESFGMTSKDFREMIGSLNEKQQDLARFAEVAGMSSEQFQQAFKEDAMGAILAFVGGLGDIQEAGGDVFGTLEDLGITEIRMRDALLRAAGAGDLFAEAAEIGSRAWEENIALSEEASRRYETTAAQIDILKNRIIDVGITLGAVLIPMLIRLIDNLDPVIEAIASAAEWFAGLPVNVQMFVVALGILAAAIGPVLVSLGLLIIALGAISAPILLVVGAIALLVAAGVAIAIWRDDIIRIFKDVDDFFGGKLSATIEWVAGFIRKHIDLIILSFGLLIAPIVLVIASFTIWRDDIIRIVSGVASFLSDTWRSISSAFVSAWNTIVSTISGIWSGIQDLADTIWTGITDTIIGVWDSITGTLSAIWSTIAGIFSTIWNSQIGQELRMTLDTWAGWISSIWDGIITNLEAKWNALSSLASTVFGAISQAIETRWNQAKAITSAVWSAVETVLSATWNAIKSVADAVFGAISTVIQNKWNQIQSITSTVWRAIDGLVIGIWNGIKGAAEAVFSSISSSISNKWNEIQTITSTVWNAIKTIIQTVWDGIVSYVTNTIQNIETIIVTSLQFLRGDFDAVWNTIKGIVSSAWDSIAGAFTTGKDTALRIWDDLRSGITNTLNDLQEGMMRPFRYVRDNIGSVFRALGTNIINPINTVIGGFERFTGALASAVNWVSNNIGMGSLLSAGGAVLDRIPGLATGTDYWRGGVALVGERGPELVNLPRGAGVMPNAQTEALLAAMKSGLAIGGPFGWAKDKASDLAGGIIGAGTAAFNFVTDWIAKGAAALFEAALAAVGFSMPQFGGVMDNLANGVFNKLKSGIIEYIDGLLTGAKERMATDLINPMMSYIQTQGFGRTAFSGVYASGSHTGVDLAAPMGTPVHASAYGTVGQAGWSGGYGNLITLIHNGLSTLYGHLSSILVSVGQTVAQGQLIGRVGSTGFSTGPHLHFEVREGGVPIDPSQFIPFKRGGITRNPTLAVLSESGQNEAVIPLDSPRARNMLRGLAGDGGTEVNFNGPVTIEARDRSEAERSASNFAYGMQVSMRARGLR